MSKKCKYVPYYQCNNNTVKDSDYCEKHINERCVSCGDKAIKGCPYEGQFVCCYPLCDKCEGYNKDGKASGNWGYLNHSHRRKMEKENAHT